MAKETQEPYVHEHFPKVMYRREDDGTLGQKKVHDPVGHEEALLSGWVESPADVPSVDEVKTKEKQLEDANAELRRELAALKAGGAKAPAGGKGSKPKVAAVAEQPVSADPDAADDDLGL